VLGVHTLLVAELFVLGVRTLLVAELFVLGVRTLLVAELFVLGVRTQPAVSRKLGQLLLRNNCGVEVLFCISSKINFNAF
jgi:hypothetical protein